jgi:hypothetical protein
MRKGASSPPGATRQVRVRSRPLEEIDEAKLALALWLMAKRLAEESGKVVPLTTDQPTSSGTEEVA